MKLFDQVKYTEKGEETIATVLEIRNLDHHDGENGEPLLHLGFFAPVLQFDAKGAATEKKVVGTHDAYSLVQFRIDVAHVSHEFSAEAEKAGLKGIYPGGRWSEIEITSAEPEDVAESTGLVLSETTETTETTEENS